MNARRLLHRRSAATLLATAALAFALPLFAQDAGTHGYMRYPDLHGSKVVFTSSNDLYLADVSGGMATRLTSHEGQEQMPKFSPDGKWIAFTGEYYGNSDVFVIPATGGEPRQLTFHGTADVVIGWDKKGRVLFNSDRLPPYRARELYAVAPEGGYPEKLPYFRGGWLVEEPNGPRVALIHNYMPFHVWNQYKGGQAEKIWIGDPTVPEFELVSHYKGNESFPMWADNDRLYFVMDSTGRENIWSMMPDGSGLVQETMLEGDDVRWPSLDGNRIIFQKGLGLSIFSLEDGSITDLDITVPSDLYRKMLRFVEPGDYLTDWRLNEDGSRLVAAARGEIFTLPVKGEGLIRQYTFSSGSREHDVAFLPGSEGTLLAISDASGEERFVRVDTPNGELSEIESKPLNDWKYDYRISPDGSKLAYCSGTMDLWLVEIESGKRSKIDKGGWEIHDYRWSPDSRYIAYSNGQNDRSYLYVFDSETGERHLVSRSQFPTYSPAWDPEGRFLYCVSDRNFNAYQHQGRGQFFFGHTATLMLIRLRNDVADPFIAHGDVHSSGIPEASWMTSGDEAKKDDSEEDEETVKPLNIEFDGILARTSPIPEKSGNYSNIEAVGDKFYYVEYPIRAMSGQDGHTSTSTAIRLYDLAKRESEEVLSGTGSYELSGDLSTIVVRKGGSWYYGDAGSASLSTGGDNMVSTDGWSVEVNPGEEWKQILRENWRQQREFFYAGNMHGVDWETVYDHWAPRIDRMTTRDDLLDVLREVQAELHAGHAYVWGGDTPDPEAAPVGYLGVDVEPDPKSGFYRITKVITSEPGTDNGASPLFYADPSSGAGTYILAVDGRPAEASQNLNRLLQNKAGKEVALTLNEKPSLKGAREVIIETMRSERDLRYYDWTHQVMDYVTEKSDGKLGYFHLRDMSSDGMADFGRNYYPQRLKPGMIVDDRYNGGGNISELLMKEMTSPIFALQSTRYGAPNTKPPSSYYGHIAVLINEATASDGESMAYATRTLGFGELIGERTWGGWIWIWPRRNNVDGGGLSVPEFGGWGLNGDWIIEGDGVSPEVKVVNDPASEMQGIDPQLDYAIQSLMEKIAADPRALPTKPVEGPVR